MRYPESSFSILVLFDEFSSVLSMARVEVNINQGSLHIAMYSRRYNEIESCAIFLEPTIKDSFGNGRMWGFMCNVSNGLLKLI